MIPKASDAFFGIGGGIAAMIMKYGILRTDRQLDILSNVLKYVELYVEHPEEFMAAIGRLLFDQLNILPWEQVANPISSGYNDEELAEKARESSDNVKASSSLSTVESIDGIQPAIKEDLEKTIKKDLKEFKAFPDAVIPASWSITPAYLFQTKDAGRYGGSGMQYPVVRQRALELADRMAKQEFTEKITECIAAAEIAVSQMKEVVKEASVGEEAMGYIEKMLQGFADEALSGIFDEENESAWRAIASNFAMLNEVGLKREMMLDKIGFLFTVRTRIIGLTAAMESVMFSHQIKRDIQFHIGNALNYGTSRRDNR